MFLEVLCCKFGEHLEMIIMLKDILHIEFE